MRDVRNKTKTQLEFSEKNHCLFFMFFSSNFQARIKYLISKEPDNKQDLNIK
jgi:hypothetical protein